METKKIFFQKLNLQLFAEGAGAGGSGTGAEGATGVTGTNAVSQGKGVKGNPLANVVYGKQADTAQTADVQKVTTEAEAAIAARKSRKLEDKNIAEKAIDNTISQITAKEEDELNDLELVAVIAAAIAAATGSSTDDFVVRSIRKVRR